jgi:hypothetical protein
VSVGDRRGDEWKGKTKIGDSVMDGLMPPARRYGI